MFFGLALVVALAISFFVTPLAIKAAHKMGVVDIPNARKVHAGAIPRMGGVAIYIAFVVGTLILGVYTWQVAALLIASTIVMAFGLLDDIRGISPKVKLLGQVFAALILIKFGYSVQFITNPFDGGVISLGFWAIPITVIWLVGISNAVNLIDGLDGLSSGVSIICALTMAVVCYASGQVVAAAISSVLAASAFGFLRYNFHPAKTFMGDCGSLFLGFVLGALAILGLSKGATIISIFIPLLIMGIPICDTLFAIVRRAYLHKPILEADRGHLHHCLLDRGLTHRQTVLVIYAITAVMGLAAILMALLTTSQSVIVLIIMTVAIFVGADKIGVLRGSIKTKSRSNYRKVSSK